MSYWEEEMAGQDNELWREREDRRTRQISPEEQIRVARQEGRPGAPLPKIPDSTIFYGDGAWGDGQEIWGTNPSVRTDVVGE